MTRSWLEAQGCYWCFIGVSGPAQNTNLGQKELSSQGLKSVSQRCPRGVSEVSQVPRGFNWCLFGSFLGSRAPHGLASTPNLGGKGPSPAGQFPSVFGLFSGFWVCQTPNLGGKGPGFDPQEADI